MQICFSNFNGVSSGTWQAVVSELANYFRFRFDRYDTSIAGKVTTIYLCCYAQDPQGLEQYLKTEESTFWDHFLEDFRKFDTNT